MVTVIDVVVSPVLHNRLPVNDPAVNVELPQLFTTVTVGVGTTALFGAAIPEPAALVQPLMVCVTVYVPEVATVIEAVVAPLLHNKEPVNDPAVRIELPQLFVTVTVGVGTAALFGAATPEAGALVHPLIVCVTV